MALTNVVGTLTLPDGTLYNGNLNISWGSIPWTSDAGTLIPAGPPILYAVKNGVVDINLEPTDGNAVPSGIQYQVLYRPTGSQTVVQYWSVPTSGSPVALSAVIVPAADQDPSVNYLPIAGGTLTGKLTLTPGSGTYALDVTKSGSSGTARFYDQTASTGITGLELRAGAGQSTNFIFTVKNNAGTFRAGADSAGVYSTVASFDVATITQVQVFGLKMSSSGSVTWSNGLGFGLTTDTALSRSAAGVVLVENGSGSPRDIKARSVILSTSTPASASATGVAGTITWDSDWVYVCVATDTWKRVAIATW